MKRALISDIHGNLEGLRAVLDDIREQGVKEIFCLGDIIGYGPNPRECLETVMQRCKLSILGNHDQGAMFDPEGFNSVALEAIYWTRDQLDIGRGAAQRWDYLGEMLRFHKDGDFLFVHGSPREPTNEYIFPEDVYDQRKMDALFNRIEKYCFTGHTHLPGIFTMHQQFVSPDDCGYHFTFSDDKFIVNVGSVGQPRDNDPRSCYAILDTEEPSITFRRVEYNIDATAEKIYAVPDLANMLGDRLRMGR